MRKAQTEVLGLIVIVVLFIAIFFIYLAFSAEKADNELKESLESSSFLRAMMFYTPRNPDGSLCGKQIREIAEECREGKVECGRDCNELLDKEIQNILERGIDKDYGFALTSGGYAYKGNPGSCSVGILDSYKTRNMEARIRICR